MILATVSCSGASSSMGLAGRGAKELGRLTWSQIELLFPNCVCANVILIGAVGDLRPARPWGAVTLIEDSYTKVMCSRMSGISFLTSAKIAWLVGMRGRSNSWRDLDAIPGARWQCVQCAEVLKM